LIHTYITLMSQIHTGGQDSLSLLGAILGGGAMWVRRLMGQNPVSTQLSCCIIARWKRIWLSEIQNRHWQYNAIYIYR